VNFNTKFNLNPFNSFRNKTVDGRTDRHSSMTSYGLCFHFIDFAKEGMRIKLESNFMRFNLNFYSVVSCASIVILYRHDSVARISVMTARFTTWSLDWHELGEAKKTHSVPYMHNHCGAPASEFHTSATQIAMKPIWPMRGRLWFTVIGHISFIVICIMEMWN
jgi:hypothetical protein